MVMAIPRKAKRAKIGRHNIGLTTDVKQMLDAVCQARGWTYIECIRRTLMREQSAIESESVPR